MQHYNVPKKDRGFTLIEMLVTTVIVGAISAIVVPNLLGMIYKARITDGVAAIEGAIKEAKSQAIRLSRSCNIQLTTDTINGETRAVVQIVAGGNNAGCLLQRRILPSGVTVANNTANPILGINFSGKGNIGNTNQYVPPNNGNWTITVSHNNLSTSKCVRVEGLFGDVQTGIIQGGACNTNL